MRAIHPPPPPSSVCRVWRGYIAGWGRQLGGGGRRRHRVFLAKLDLQNAYWSIKPPRAWRRAFVVESQSGRRYRYARLPCGWSYSPAICQALVTAVIRRVLGRKGIKGWVYLDNVLLSARRRLRRGVRECIRRLRAAGFIVGGKSEPSPKEQITFIGKRINTREGTIGNSVGALISAFRTWVRGVGRGRLPSKAMERLLGKVCWLARPNAGLGHSWLLEKKLTHRHKSSNNRAQKKTVNKHCAAPQGTETLIANIQKTSGAAL